MGGASVPVHDHIGAFINGRQQFMRCVISCNGHVRREGTQKDEDGHGRPAFGGDPDCQYTGDDGHAPVSLLRDTEGIDAVADCYDAEGSEVYSERNTVWSHLCFGRRASYFCLRDGFEQWTI